MTTESMQVSHDSGRRVLLGAAAASALMAVVVVLLAAVLGGSSAAYGALVGAVLAIAVLFSGSFVVNAVAGIMPAAALMVALLTYVLQVIVLALAFAVISGSGLLDGTLDRTWLGATIIAGTLAWIGAQVLLATSRRIPVYDLAGTGER